jgi:hypothetical protein
MWGTVLMFALMCACEPTRIGIAALLVALPRPFRNLLAFWLGLWTSAVGLALAGLFLLRDYIAPIMQVLRFAAASPVVPPIKIIFGVLAISIAAMLFVRSSVRQAAPVPVPVPVGGHSGWELASKRPTVFSRVSTFALGRLSWSAVLDRGSVKMAFVAGLSTSAPPIEFCGAVLAILASGAAAGTQVSAFLMFMLVAYAIAEIPLVCYLAAPTKTPAIATQLNGWLRAHPRPIFLSFLSVFGVLMVAGGVGSL